ncbi:MAG: hypothetical protein DSM106950_33180 [Stigonema ocellatum SAG 48.90 = DSM 106950]|nr:hypothetical protein [Stigonema ocellatum SAG 48.90 = DSM 106950]
MGSGEWGMGSGEWGGRAMNERKTPTPLHPHSPTPPLPHSPTPHSPFYDIF